MENTTTPVTTTSVGIRYGLLTGLVSIIFSFLQLSFIEDPETPLRWLSLLILVGGIWLAHKQFKQLRGGFMAYGEGLGIGTIVAAVSGVLGGVFSYIYLTFIDPGYMQRHEPDPLAHGRKGYGRRADRPGDGHGGEILRRGTIHGVCRFGSLAHRLYSLVDYFGHHQKSPPRV